MDPLNNEEGRCSEYALHELWSPESGLYGGLGFRVWGLGFRLWGLGFGVWGLGFGVEGLGFRVYEL